MKVCHTPAAVSAAFDDANLIAHAGLVPVMRLAERCGLSRLIAGKAKLTGAKNGAGAAADAKVTSIVGGMVVGADSIDDLDVLSDANGLPLLVGISAANTHDSEGLKPMVEGHHTRHDPHNGRYFKPQRLHAYKAYDRADLRGWLRGKRIGVRIARKGIESSELFQR